MSDDASIRFHLAPDIFISFFSTTYSPQQCPDTWHACHLPSIIVFSVISVQHKQPFEVSMPPVKRLPKSIVTGCSSAPKCRWTTCLKIRRTLLLRQFRCLVIESVTDTTPHGCPVSRRTQLLWSDVLFHRLTSWKATGTLGSRLGPTAGMLTNASPACSATMVSRTPYHSVRMQSPWVLRWLTSLKPNLTLSNSVWRIQLSFPSFFVSVHVIIPRPIHTAARPNLNFKTCSSMMPMVSSRRTLLHIFSGLTW